MKILIVRLTALGDIIHSAVVLQFIKSRIKDIQIDWLIEETWKDILENHPHINKIHTIDLKSLKDELDISKISPLYARLREIGNENYDFIIDMQGLLKSAIISKVIGAKNIHGFSYSSAKEGLSALFYTSTSSISYSENKIWRNAKLINDSLKIAISFDDILKKEKHLFFYKTGKAIFNEKDIDIIFVVGSSMAQKNYPKEKFLEIARELTDRKISVIWGNSGEFETGRWLEQRCERLKLAPKMELDDLKRYISHASIVIGNDTGPTHIAWALNVPSLILFGMTPPEQMIETEINKFLKSSSAVSHRHLNKNDVSIGEIRASDALIEIYKILNK